MVNYLHSALDDAAGRDVAALYDTRTLNKILEVNDANARQITADLLSARMRVVVPAEEHRLNDAALRVLRCLQIMRVPVSTVPGYLQELMNPDAPASAQVHAHADGPARSAALPAPAG